MVSYLCFYMFLHVFSYLHLFAICFCKKISTDRWLNRSLLKQDAELAAARLAQQATDETHLFALEAQLTAEQVKFQEAQTRHEAELKRF